MSVRRARKRAEENLPQTLTKFRLFIGGLGSKITPEDLSLRFAQFGTVSDVRVAACRFDDVPETCRGFAHLTLEAFSIQKCMTILNNCRWGANKMKIELANEDFAQRLAKRNEVELAAWNKRKETPKEREPEEKKPEEIKEQAAEVPAGEEKKKKKKRVRKGIEFKGKKTTTFPEFKPKPISKLSWQPGDYVSHMAGAEPLDAGDLTEEIEAEKKVGLSVLDAIFNKPPTDGAKTKPARKEEEKRGGEEKRPRVEPKQQREEKRGGETVPRRAGEEAASGKRGARDRSPLPQERVKISRVEPTPSAPAVPAPTPTDGIKIFAAAAPVAPGVKFSEQNPEMGLQYWKNLVSDNTFSLASMIESAITSEAVTVEPVARAPPMKTKSSTPWKSASSETKQSVARPVLSTPAPPPIVVPTGFGFMKSKSNKDAIEVAKEKLMLKKSLHRTGRK